MTPEQLKRFTEESSARDKIFLELQLLQLNSHPLARFGPVIIVAATLVWLVFLGILVMDIRDLEGEILGIDAALENK